MIMKKDFDGWNEKKKDIHNNREHKLYHAREIWWCNLGINVGFEEDGVGSDSERPVLILKGLSANTCFVMPLTTSKSRHPMRIPIGAVEDKGKENSAIISQMRIVDTKRLVDKIGFLDKDKFEIIRKAIREIF
jgi:mRNA interferase MazF